jgi:hypothetical protein
MLMTAYATGMRVSELCNLRGCDIDSSPDRMCIRIVAGKGGHDRYSLLTPELLDQLRLCWRRCRRHARPEDWLFPARLDASNALDARSVGRYFHIARNGAGIDKVGGSHTLRHYSESREMPSSVGKTLAAGGVEGFLLTLNSAYSGTSQSLEEGHQLIVGPEPSNSTFARFDLVESRLFDVVHLDQERARHPAEGHSRQLTLKF